MAVFIFLMPKYKYKRIPDAHKHMHNTCRLELCTFSIVASRIPISDNYPGNSLFLYLAGIGLCSRSDGS